uniref:2OG-Fe(II) oxygenase superfamily protein n=1 Tax=Mimivirus LCMiAC02 TaxID=2506609 RepID=A0A481Z1V3_9VIRU|nr:MAG: 2OG-Fe(II) oxygenase superfamily protein [Mimivirus LCMiAC02]
MISIFKNREELKKKVDLDNYYYFKKYFKDDEIDKIIKIADKYTKISGTVSTTVDKSYRSSKIKWLPHNEDTSWIYDKLSQLTKIANKNSWEFDIIGFGEDIQLGEYTAEEEGHYDWHLDIGGSVSWRKISISVQLSGPDEYEGGDLQFRTGRYVKTAPKDKGTVILFPSYFLHRITKITKGTRKSLVIWISGHPFK